MKVLLRVPQRSDWPWAAWALMLCAVGLFALGAALGWVPIGVSDRPLWIRIGVALMGFIGLAGGVTSLAMLSLRLTPVQISNSGLRPPALRFVLSKKRGGEFIEKREIASLEIHETDLELKVTLRTRLGAVRVFGCSKDQWDRLLSVAPPPRDSYTNDPLRT